MGGYWWKGRRQNSKSQIDVPQLLPCSVDRLVGGWVVLMEREKAEFEEPNRCSTAVFMFGWHVTQTRPPCMRGPASTPNGRWLPNIAHKLCGHRLPHRMAAGCPTLFPNYAALSCQPGIHKLQMGNQNYELSNWQPVAQHLSGLRAWGKGVYTFTNICTSIALVDKISSRILYIDPNYESV